MKVSTNAQERCAHLHRPDAIFECGAYPADPLDLFFLANPPTTPRPREFMLLPMWLSNSTEMRCNLLPCQEMKMQMLFSSCHLETVTGDIIKRF